MLKGLEISVILKSNLERTIRMDSEFYSKENLNIIDILSKHKLNNITQLVNVSDGNHMAISDNFVDIGIPYYRGQNIHNYFIEESNPIFIDIKTFNLPVMKRSHLKKGDVLLSIVGTIGGVSLVTSNAQATCNCKLAIFRPLKTDGYFLSAFLKSKYGQNQIKKFTRGAVQMGLILEDMNQIMIPVFSSDYQNQIKDLIQKAKEKSQTSKQLYQQAEDTLMFEVGLNTLSSDFLRKLELELKPNKTPEETMEYLEKYSNTARNSFEAAHDIFMDMLDVHPNLIEDLLERGEVEIAKLLQQGMETKMKLQEYDIQQAQKNKELLIKGYEAQTNLMDLSEARLKNFNIKKLSDSFIKTGRLDAEYYQQKYEVIENVIKKNKYERLAKIVEIEKSIEPGSNNYTEEAGLPFYRVSDYNKLGLSKPNKELSKSFVEENQNLIEKIKPKKGTILFSKDGSVGTAYLLRENLNGITSGAILHLKIKDNKKIIPEYLTLTLNSNLVKMQAERDAGGSIILHWRKEEIEQVLVPILDINKQKEIADLVEQSFKLKTESERLLDVAKKAVEIAIEEDEENAMDYIKKN